MPWNGSGTANVTDGTFTGKAIFTAEKTAGTQVLAARFDNFAADLCTMLQNCHTLDGQTQGNILNLTATVNATTGVINIGSVNFGSLFGTNNAFGGGAGNFSLSGTQLTGFGQQALAAASSGANSSAFGWQALTAATTGGTNSAFGALALSTITTGQACAAFGYSALKSATGNNNTAFGSAAGINVSSGTDNAFLGEGAGGNVTTGSSNVVIGSQCTAQSATASGQINIACTIFGTAATGTGNTPGSGKIGLNVVGPTAVLHLPASTTSANTAPIKINTGTLMTSPENGAIEFDGTHLYITIGGVRKQLDN